MQMGVREKSKKLINSSTDFSEVKLQNMIATSAGVNSPLYRSTKIQQNDVESFNTYEKKNVSHCSRMSHRYNQKGLKYAQHTLTGALVTLIRLLFNERFRHIYIYTPRFNSKIINTMYNQLCNGDSLQIMMTEDRKQYIVFGIVFQVTVIEEAVKYIDELHRALFERLHNKGKKVAIIHL